LFNIAAALRRAKEKGQKTSKYTMNQYYGVMAAFCATMAGAGIYTFLNPATSFATMPIIDDNNILVHNG